VAKVVELDPAHVDVVAQPRRRRRRVEVPENMRPMLAEAEARARARTAAPGLLLEPVKGDFDHPSFSSPWVDRNACELMLADCFGTRSVATFQTFVDQIAALCQKCWDPERNEWVRHEGELNQCLNIVNGLKPVNEAEAALAVTICSTYLTQSRIAGRALSGGWVDPKDGYVIAALGRTHARLWDSFNRGRGKGKTTKQKIEVRYERHDHQHVHFEGGGGNTGHQSDERAPPESENPRPSLRVPERSRLPSPQSSGTAMQACGCEGQEGLQFARRSRGRSEGPGERELSSRRDDD
jgi:hypothetical protein